MRRNQIKRQIVESCVNEKRFMFHWQISQVHSSSRQRSASISTNLSYVTGPKEHLAIAPQLGRPFCGQFHGIGRRAKVRRRTSQVTTVQVSSYQTVQPVAPEQYQEQTKQCVLASPKCFGVTLKDDVVADPRRRSWRKRQPLKGQMASAD